MSDQGFQEKTEKATPKKRDESRKKGSVAKSKELSTVAILIASLIYMFFNVKEMTYKLGNIVKARLSAIPSITGEGDPFSPMLADTLNEFILIILPLMIVLVVITIIVNLLQSGFLLSVEPLTPKLSKIDPMQGLKKVFNKRSLVELTKSILKVIIIGWAAFSVLKNDMEGIMTLMYQDNSQILALLGAISLKVMTRCSIVIFVLAILDYVYQKWEFEEGIKMTKQEIKDENKQAEGDPHVKSRIRSIQFQMARRRMMESVPKADVVITNPTHLSVALQYGGALQGMRAPRIVAKGADNIAFKIREVAKKHDVPIVENKPLAQNLYKLDIGDEIPPQFYQAVAEILAYVYGLKRKSNNIGHN